jgi:hypothetical protein
MPYRGPGFLAIVRFGSSPTSPASLPISICLSLSVLGRAYLQEGGGGGDGGEAKIIDTFVIRILSKSRT